jgi:hypothetical protein
VNSLTPASPGLILSDKGSVRQPGYSDCGQQQVALEPKLRKIHGTIQKKGESQLSAENGASAFNPNDPALERSVKKSSS